MKSSNSLQGDIHQTVAFFYQKKSEKENGAVMTIIQSPFQLPENEYTKRYYSQYPTVVCA